MTRHYDPRTITDAGRAGQAAIRDALTAFDLDTPPAVSALDLHLATIPGADMVAEQLAAESTYLDPADVEKWTTDAAVRLRAAADADRLRAALAKYAPNARKARFSDDRAAALAALAQPVAAILKTLARDVKKLPTAAPLDPAAVVDADAAREYQRTIAALEALARAAALILPKGADPVIGRLLPLLDLPDVPREQVDAWTGAAVDQTPVPQRDAVRQLWQDADRQGLDQALIRAARGDYEGVTLALAADRAEVTDRMHKADNALTKHKTERTPSRR